MTVAGQSRVMDRWAEGILQTLVEIAPEIRENQHDYDLMADFMLSATMGLNGFIAMGVAQDWATHMIGHELTALHGLTHGATLAIVLPGTAARAERAEGRQTASIRRARVGASRPASATSASGWRSNAPKDSSVRWGSPPVCRRRGSARRRSPRSNGGSTRGAPVTARPATSTAPWRAASSKRVVDNGRKSHEKPETSG